MAWYHKNGRVLPWRAAPGGKADPYAVWLSEIMLQQTTVATVKGYFNAFIERWPDVHALAAAPREDVLAAWAGLGYYARARNLHAAAQYVADTHHGQFPQTEAELRALPGVGAYTAAAIAAIAFGERAVVVDGNIERVTARWQAVSEPLPGAKPQLRDVMDALTPREGAGDFAQAMMDIGAMICTPSRQTTVSAGEQSQPACDLCPLAPTCVGRHDNPAQFPVKAPKKTKPQRRGVAVVFRDGAGRVLLEKRGDQGLLGGMLVFPGSDWADGNPRREDYPLTAGMVAADLLEHAAHCQRLNEGVDHVFTHFRLTLSIHEALIKAETAVPDGYQWVDADSLPRLALPTVMRKVAEAAGLITQRRSKNV